jgi:hypothetical protein
MRAVGGDILKQPKIPPHMRNASDEAALRALLETPFRADKIPDGPERWKAIKQQQVDQTERLFLLYGIPDDWPETIRWQQLAMSLAAEHFPGCQTSLKGAGGPGEDRREKQRDLFREFQVYVRNYALANLKKLPGHSTAARWFFDKNLKKCEGVDFKTAKSFAQALTRFAAETGQAFQVKPPAAKKLSMKRRPAF